MNFGDEKIRFLKGKTCRVQLQSPIKPKSPIAKKTKITPTTKKILKSLSPVSKKCIRKLFLEDDLYANKFETVESKNLYINDIDKKKIGKLCEYHLACFGKCPCCSLPTLEMFKNKNMPAVDLKCISCLRLFQVKSSFGNTYFGNDYITVSSTKYGRTLHTIRGNDNSETKKYLVGYICLKLSIKKEKIIIHKEKSYVLLPNIDVTNDDAYYFYEKGIYGQNVIRWNESMCSKSAITIAIKKMSFSVNSNYLEVTN